MPAFKSKAPEFPFHFYHETTEALQRGRKTGLCVCEQRLVKGTLTLLSTLKEKGM